MGKENDHNVVAEKAILGGILRNEENFDKVSPYLQDEKVFEDYETRLFWSKLKELRAKKIPIDLISVCNTLTKDDKLLGLNESFVVECSEIDSLDSRAESYASQLYEKYLLRKVIKKAKEIQEKAEGNFPNVYNTINEAHTLIGNLINIKPSKEFSVNEQLTQAINDISSKEKKLINTVY